MRSLEAIARRLVWWKPPRQTMEDRIHLLARAMSYGSLSDLQVLLAQVGTRGVIVALDSAPPGIFDRRSWRYWNLVVGREVPPMPVRTLGARL